VISHVLSHHRIDLFLNVVHSDYSTHDGVVFIYLSWCFVQCA